MDQPAYARVTLSVYEPDFSGFAPVAEISVEQFDALPGGGEPDKDRANQFVVDLLANEHTVLAEKWVSDEEVECLLGQPAQALISLGRQRLAQINDEDAERVRKIIAWQAMSSSTIH